MNSQTEEQTGLRKCSLIMNVFTQSLRHPVKINYISLQNIYFQHSITDRQT